MKTVETIAVGQGIARRYFVVNGFDGALTMLGIIMGFYFSDASDIRVVIHACTGAAVALGISGLSSAYISEKAERKKELMDLEQAMVRDLSESQHETRSNTLPFFIAAVNGLSPLIICFTIISPLFVARYSEIYAFDPLFAAICLAFVVLFLLGVFLGRVSHTHWLWSGVRTLLIALVTTAVIYLVS